jgi:hypothetical protein
LSLIWKLLDGHFNNYLTISIRYSYNETLKWSSLYKMLHPIKFKYNLYQ